MNAIGATIQQSHNEAYLSVFKQLLALTIHKAYIVYCSHKSYRTAKCKRVHTKTHRRDV